LTHVTTFHDLRTTLVTNGDGILMTLKTNGEETSTTPVTTRDYIVTILYDITYDPFDNIDNLEEITCLCLSLT
jgi:hypothetical protein